MTESRCQMEFPLLPSSPGPAEWLQGLFPSASSALVSAFILLQDREEESSSDAGEAGCTKAFQVSQLCPCWVPEHSVQREGDPEVSLVAGCCLPPAASGLPGRAVLPPGEVLWFTCSPCLISWGVDLLCMLFLTLTSPRAHGILALQTPRALCPVTPGAFRPQQT